MDAQMVPTFAARGVSAK